MTLKEQLLKLVNESKQPCVSISMNTHRTHPDSAKDEVMLKNLLKEAEKRVVAEYGKRPVASLLEKIENVASEIDLNYNLDSLHIFLSNDTTEIIRSAWTTTNEGVQISDSFAVRSIIKSYNRTQNYLLMLLSQSGVHLYEAMNDSIIREIQNDDFPFDDNRHAVSQADKGSDSKQVDDSVREFLNKVDKALIKVNNETNLNCVVICTEDNFSRLQQVADKPTIYLGNAAIDYNNTATHQIVKQSWAIIEAMQDERRSQAIGEIKEAVAHGTVLTDLQEIFQASIDGRGQLLIVHQDFLQPVIMTSERTFDLAEDTTQHDVIDDITSTIAWEVLSKKGTVFFTSEEEIKDLGEIVLKTRY